MNNGRLPSKQGLGYGPNRYFRLIVHILRAQVTLVSVCDGLRRWAVKMEDGKTLSRFAVMSGE